MTDKTITEEEALAILQNNETLQEEVYDFDNFRKSKLQENCYRFTVKIMSIDLLVSLMETDGIENVFFCPSHPPPGYAADSISLRYKIHVIFTDLVEE